MATEPRIDQVQLYPETISRRPLPLNFDGADLKLFEHELERVIPETTLLTLSDVRISADGFLYKGLRILPESFAFPANFLRWKFRARIKFFIENNVFRRARDVARDVLWVTDDWSTAYYHWLMDVMSRLVVIQDRLSQLTLLLPQTCANLEFVHTSLRCFNLKSVEFIGPREVLRCQKVFMPSHVAPTGHYNDDVIRRVRTLMVQTLGDAESNEKNDRIYISRARATKRKITNEAAVLAVLGRYGFKTVYPEDLSLEDQVKLFSRVQYLVSNHGAGLANMLFVPEGACVLELRQEDDAHRNFYFSLAAALNQKYFYQTCPRADDNAEDHLADLVVDSVVLEKNVRLLFEAGAGAWKL